MLFRSARVTAVHKMLRRSRRHGFGVNLADVVPGIDAFGMALMDGAGGVFGSINVAVPAQPASAARITAMEALLRVETRRFESEQKALMALPG